MADRRSRLLELSGALAQAKPARTLRFVAFVNEEPPFFYWSEMGSKYTPRGPAPGATTYG